MTDQRGKVTSYTYDLLHRKLTESDSLNHTTTWTYDNEVNVLTTTRADSTVTTNTYDTMDRLLTTTDPLNQTTTYTYYLDDSLASLKDARNSTYTFTVDALSRRTRMTYPGGSYENWTYDGVGNMTLYRARNAATRTSTFDNRNRDTLCDWSDTTLDASKSYDDSGRLLTLTNSSVVLTHTYDAANQTLTESYAFGGAVGTKTVGYAYDPDGNRASLTYPDASVIDYAYTARNQVSSISAGGPPPLATFTYDPAGNRLTKTLENGTTASYTYDDASRLTTVTHANASATLAALSYGYNAINLRTSGETGDTYGYDAADQLATVSYAAGGTGGYAYDGAGNRTQSLVGNTTTTYAAANALNQYGAITGLGTPLYDANGNLKVLAAFEYLHDSANRLTSVSENGFEVFSQGFDARNRSGYRLETDYSGEEEVSTATYLIYDDWNLIAEYDASGALLAKYIHGPKTDEMLAKIDTAGTVYYHENALGSTIALSEANGNVVERYTYDVYGKPTIRNGAGAVLSSTALGNRFLFTGRELLPVGLYDYRNRVYSAELGRFLQTDPIRFEAEDVNFYRYAGNNPTNLTDPSGLKSNKGVQLVFENLSHEQRVLIRQCAKTARRYAREAYKYLSDLTVAEAKQDPLYSEWFGKANKNRLRFVTAKFELMLKIFRHEKIYVTNHEKPTNYGGIAASKSFGAADVQLYGDFWEFGTQSWQVSQSTVFLHEMTHNAWRKVTSWKNPQAYWGDKYRPNSQLIIDKDGGYGVKGAQSLSPNESVVNADNYALFGTDVSGQLPPNAL